MYVSLFTSSFLSNWTHLNVCNIDKLQCVYTKHWYTVSSSSPHVWYTGPYSSFRFAVLFLFPEVAQLHSVLEEIILCVGEAKFLPLSWLFSLIVVQ